MDPSVTHILLVEDNEAHAELVRRAFESRAERRYKLSVCRDLKDARRLLAGVRPNLILADLRLPDGDGVELIPQHPCEHTCPTVIMTGYGDEAVAVQVMKAGALDYVVKSEAVLKDMPHVVERALREWGHILERKRVERELHHERQRHAHIVAVAPTLICCVSPLGITSSINRAVTTITGYAPDDLVGKHFWHTLYPGEDYQQVDRLFLRLDQGPVVNHETTLTTKDGSKRTVLWSSIRRLDPSGQVQEIVGIGADITDQKRLTHQLRQSQKLEVVGTLASGVAHDIHNMLAVINRHVELAHLSLPQHHPAERSLNIIEQMSQRSDATMRSMLTFASEKSLTKSPVNLVPLVEEAVRWLRDLMPSSIQIILEQPRHISAWTYADPTQIHQVLMNLAVNARDAMHRGGELRIKWSSELPGESSSPSGTVDQKTPIVLVVEDTGHGIPPQVIKRVFEPFFTTKGKEEGTGLGLSVIYSIMEELQGRIEIDSTIGRGTRLTLFFPRYPRPGLDKPDAPTSEAEDLRLAHGETALVVQPDRQLRSMMASTLKARGFKVIQAGNPDQALRQLESPPPAAVDLVVVDCDHPTEGDRAALKEIDRRYRDSCLIAVGNAWEAHRHRGRDGKYKRLRKPFLMTELADAARQIVTRGEVEQPTR